MGNYFFYDFSYNTDGKGVRDVRSEMLDVRFEI